jgi:hypothetical protein
LRLAACGAAAPAELALSACQPSPVQPNLLQKLFYLSGIGRASAEHRPWLQRVLDDPEPRRRGALLSLPNATIVGGAGLLMLGVWGDLFGIAFLAAALLVVAVGATVPAIATRRAQLVARKNGLTLP